ncbi:MAG: glycosyltransferase family 1 protein [Candidatus Brocadiaceae bacterium]|nr:glycosyltransferase family 1 protein [Candidatus Brocadiaceae bacterium]
MADKTLHVLQVTGPMNRGGAEIMLMDIYRNLSPDIRFDFLINEDKNITKTHGDFDEEIMKRGARLLHIGKQWDLWVIKYILHFRKIIREIGRPDVVHIHMNAKCGIIALAARLSGIKKIIAHSHAALKFKGPLFQILPSIVELKLQKILIALFATDFWGCSKEANESLFLSRLIKKHKFLVLNNAVDIKTFQNVHECKKREILRSCSIKDETLVLGNVGRVVKHKKVDFIIDILRLLNEKNVDCVFVFAGREDDQPYMSEIRQKAKAFHVEDKILHLGDRDDIPVVMSTFDVFVGPALNEGFGLVAVEAQSAGLPCVLSTGFSQDVDMGLNLVTYLNGYQPDKWVDAILKTKGNKCFDKDLITRKIVERGFDVSKNTVMIEQLYSA